MSMKLQGYKSGNTSAPIYIPSAATLAFAALTGRLAWLEGDAGALISNGKWYDRATGVGYPVTGTLAGGADTYTTGGITRGAAVFAGQSVDLGSIMPVGADYSIFAVYKQSNEVTQAVHSLLGSSGASWHAFHLNQTSGRLNMSQAAANQYAGAVDHTPGSVYRAGLVYTETPRTRTIYFNGTQEATGSVSASNADPTAIVGNIPGLGTGRKFFGSLYHISLWSRAPSGSDLTAINAYLAEQYG